MAEGPAWLKFLDVSSTTRLAASLTWLRKLPNPLLPGAAAAIAPGAACGSAKHAPMISASQLLAQLWLCWH